MLERDVLMPDGGEYCLFFFSPTSDIEWRFFPQTLPYGLKGGWLEITHNDFERKKNREIFSHAG